MPASDKDRLPLAYCANCNRVFEAPGKLSPYQVGLPFECPEEPLHVAAIVSGETGKAWLRLSKWLLAYEHKHSLFAILRTNLGEMFQDAGPYLVFRFFILVLTLWAATCSMHVVRYLASLVAVFFIAEILLVHVAIAFVSRFPADTLRSIVFSFFSFVQLALGFAVLFAALEQSFVRVDNASSPVRLGLVDAFYFSLLIMTTVGWADIIPNPHDLIVKIIILFELIFS